MGSNFETVSTYMENTQAQVAKSYLESQGITCHLLEDHASSLMPYAVPIMGGIHLQVMKSDIADARKVLNSLGDTPQSDETDYLSATPTNEENPPATTTTTTAMSEKEKIMLSSFRCALFSILLPFLLPVSFWLLFKYFKTEEPPSSNAKLYFYLSLIFQILALGVTAVLIVELRT